jgi:hypothetical protein
MRSIARMARKAFGTGPAERAVAPIELIEQLVELSLPRGTGVGDGDSAFYWLERVVAVPVVAKSWRLKATYVWRLPQQGRWR